MSDGNHITASSHDAGMGSTLTYAIGFGLSIVLTAIAFTLVQVHVAHHHTYPSDGFLKLALVGLAVIQLFIQLVFFLHLGRGSKPRWNAWALAFAVTVVVIIVIGSLWIMSNLNYRMMYSPKQTQQYLHNQGDL